MHFAVMTITSIGYGDIVPTDTSEQVVGLFLMVIAGIQWASAIGTLCSVIGDTEERKQFKEDLDVLNTHLSENEVEATLRQRLREFLHQSASLRRHRAIVPVLEQMSPQLKEDLVAQTNGHWIQSIKILRGMEESTLGYRAFQVDIALALVRNVFSPLEVMSEGPLYIVTLGHALFNAQVMKAEACFGQDSFLQAPHLRRKSLGISIDYCDVYMVEPAMVMETARTKYPAIAFKIRTRVAWLALRRMIVFLAAEVASCVQKNLRSDGLSVVASTVLKALPSVRWLFDTDDATPADRPTPPPKLPPPPVSPPVPVPPLVPPPVLNDVMAAARPASQERVDGESSHLLTSPAVAATCCACADPSSRARSK